MSYVPAATQIDIDTPHWLCRRREKLLADPRLLAGLLLVFSLGERFIAVEPSRRA